MMYDDDLLPRISVIGGTATVPTTAAIVLVKLPVSSTYTITLPDIVVSKGKILTIRVIDTYGTGSCLLSSTADIYLVAAASDTEIPLYAVGDYAVLYSDGVSWHEIAALISPPA